MWVLENEGGAFEGKRLWLRPGQRYLFGRTVAEPGQLAIKGDPAALKSVSRRHCTIRVDEVTEGDGQKPSSRSQVTIEDLGSKSGTRINDHKLRGDTYVLTEPENTLQMGSFQEKFKITWFPVVLSYSFSSKELRASPFTKLQQNLEQLDIKYLADYDARWTTHVVHKKRNTPKGLQALINGNYIVNDAFVNSILAVTAPEHVSEGVDRSPLEADFDGNWPDAVQFLPATGDDAAPIPNEQFAPNPARSEIFDGYTFVFYEKKQFDFLMAPITTGKGKALLKEVIPEETQIDDFIRYVKGVAGEKGLGEFEDGSEGKGVVVVQFMPTNQEHLEWYTQFYTTVSLRLDQRLISQKDFLPAILNNDASGLRRPLEEETEQQQQPNTHSGNQTAAASEAMDVDNQPPVAPLQPLARRRQRGAAKSKFRGFGVTLDSDEDEQPAEAPPLPTPAPAAAEPESSQEGLFVSQSIQSQASEVPIRNTRQSQRKRPAAPDPEDVLDGFAPTAAEVKRRRVAAGEDPIPREATPTPAEAAKQQQPAAAKTPKIKKEIDVLDVARQHREEIEARARAEREDLATAPEGLDLAEIRRLHIEEPMALRQPPTTTRTRDQEVADGRWDPAWNGRKNFKKFQRRGAVQGRAPPRIIVALDQVQAKAYGIGDDYWLENENNNSMTHQSRNKKKTTNTNADSFSTTASAGVSISQAARRSQTPSETRTQTQSRSNVRAASRGASAVTAAASGGSAGSLQSTNNTNSKRIEGLAPVDSSEAEEDGDGDGDGDMQLDDDHGRQAIVGEGDDEDDDDVIAASASRSMRSARTTAQPSQQSRSSRSTANTTTAKRPAMAPPLTTTRAKPAKRPKIFSVADSDDESEDELKFRFGRR